MLMLVLIITLGIKRGKILAAETALHQLNISFFCSLRVYRNACFSNVDGDGRSNVTMD